MTIYPTGKADFDGPLRVDLKNVVVPIGTTGLIMDGYWLELRPKDKKETVTIGTNITVAPPANNALSMQIKITFGFPISATGIKYEGKLVAGKTQNLGKISGLISKEKLTGRLQMPDPGAAGQPLRPPAPSRPTASSS